MKHSQENKSTLCILHFKDTLQSNEITISKIDVRIYCMCAFLKTSAKYSLAGKEQHSQVIDPHCIFC